MDLLPGLHFPDLSLYKAKVLKWEFINLTYLQFWFLDGQLLNIWDWFRDAYSGKTPTVLVEIVGTLCPFKTPASKSLHFGTPGANVTFQPLSHSVTLTGNDSPDPTHPETVKCVCVFF